MERKTKEQGKKRRLSLQSGSLLCLLLLTIFMSGCAIHPEELDTEKLWMDVQKDVLELTENQEDVETPVTLYEAMARAIKYNREYRFKMMKSALSMKQMELSKFDFLPDLTADAGYSKRNNDSASSSKSYETGLETLEPSISQDRERITADVTFTWNVLDFGLSYVRAHQKADRYLITKEAERKTIQNIINDVRVAWWSALSAQRLLATVPSLMSEVEKALAVSVQIERQMLDTPLTALNYQRSLLNMLRSLEELREELNQAKPQLAFLMGLPFDQTFTIADPGEKGTLPHLDWDVDTMEKIALLSRPELMESHYQQRITQQETRVALLRLLPSIDLDAGWNWDHNSYLVNNTWFDYGAQISGSLLDLVKIPATLNAAETSEEVSRQHGLVVSTTVLMQIHLAKAAHLQSEHNFALEDQALEVESRILKQNKATLDTDTEGRQALIHQQLNHLLAKFRRDTSYAEMENNFGRLLWTMGIDPIPEELRDTSVAGLAASIESSIKDWKKSSLSDVETLDAYLPHPPQVAGNMANGSDVQLQ